MDCISVNLLLLYNQCGNGGAGLIHRARLPIRPGCVICIQNHKYKYYVED
jgi:hypothetical protein